MVGEAMKKHRDSCDVRTDVQCAPGPSLPSFFRTAGREAESGESKLSREARREANREARREARREVGRRLGVLLARRAE